MRWLADKMQLDLSSGASISGSRTDRQPTTATNNEVPEHDQQQQQPKASHPVQSSVSVCIVVIVALGFGFMIIYSPVDGTVTANATG